MPSACVRSLRLPVIDEPTRHLVRIAAAIAGSDEQTTRSTMTASAGVVSLPDVEEVILQSYLFAGFPRALNAARIWRSVTGAAAPLTDPAAELSNSSDWFARGEDTCRTVYGDSYDLLRKNIRELHPALDTWMIADGYGKVLSRSQLDLKTRELCIVAACATSAQQRQLHSHLHGALNAGASVDEVTSTLESIMDLVAADNMARYQGLLAHVLSSRSPAVTGGMGNVR